MDVVEAILTRNAQGKLTLPAPDVEIMHRAFSCAMRAPDHQVLRPWRYIVIEGAALIALGELFMSASLATEPDLSAEAIEKLCKMPLRAPMIVVAITVFKDAPKVPREEQLLSTGAAVQNFILAMHDAGFTSMWRTGALAENAKVRQGLGVAEHEHISGFIYVGTASGDAKKIVHPDTADFVSVWWG